MLLLADLPPVSLHPSGLFWTVFGQPSHEPQRLVMGRPYAPVIISIEQYPVFYGVSGGFVRSRNDMMGFEVICAARNCATAGGVDRGAPYGHRGHITPPTPITPGNSAIALF